MKITDIVNFLNEIEKKWEVDKWTIDKVHIWPLIRMDLFFSLMYTYLGYDRGIDKVKISGKIQLAFNVLKGLSKFFYSKISDFKNNDTLNKKVNAVFLGDGISFAKIENKWFDKFCDPFINYFNEKKIISLRLDTLHNYHIPRFYPSVFIQPFIDFSIIKSLFFKKKNKSNNEHLPGLSEFLLFLKSKNFKVPTPDIQNVKAKALKIRGLAEFYKKILKKTKPGIGLTVSYYGDYPMAFNLACREFGIPSVDIQHGGEGDLHAAYGRWNKIPLTGYELLPTIFWCWSEAEAAIIKKWNYKVENWHKVMVGGNLLLEMWKNDSFDFINNYEKKILNIKKENNNPNILLTLGFDISTEENLKNTFEAIKKSQKQLNWWIRLHPSMLNKKEIIKKTLLNKEIHNFEMDIVTEVPLYSLLKHVDAHVTYISTTVVEAQQFNVPSVITSNYGADFFPDQIASGWSVKACASNEIIDAINFQLKRKQELINNASEKKVQSQECLDHLIAIINKS